MIQYQIFFSFEDTILQLPMNPETLPVELAGENEQYNVLGIGPITIPRTPQQKRVKIAGLLPALADTPPETYLKFFQDAMYEQRVIVYTPVRIDETGEKFNGGDDGFECLVENITAEERGGEPGDFYYELEIVEYRDYTPQIVEVRPIQTGYAASSTRVRVSEGIQVGDTVNVSGPVYNYSSETQPVGNTTNAKAIVKRKDDGLLTLVPTGKDAIIPLYDDSPRKNVPVVAKQNASVGKVSDAKKELAATTALWSKVTGGLSDYAVKGAKIFGDLFLPAPQITGKKKKKSGG